jgi:hypothetical protein
MREGRLGHKRCDCYRRHQEGRLTYMPMNPETLKAMKEAAAKAQKKCPGPWYVDSDDAEECGPHAHSGLFKVNSGRSNDDWTVARLCEATEAAHIAKCDPDSILALIADYERLQKLAREAYDHYMGPQACGDFTCTCGEVDYCGLCEIRTRWEHELGLGPR